MMRMMKKRRYCLKSIIKGTLLRKNNIPTNSKRTMAADRVLYMMTGNREQVIKQE
jgi:hypothetical protein